MSKSAVVPQDQNGGIRRFEMSGIRAFAAQAGLTINLDLPAEQLVTEAVNAINFAHKLNLAAGLALLHVKEMCEHGEFEAHLQAAKFSRQRASEHMAVAQALLNVKPDQLGKLMQQPKTALIGLARMDDAIRQELLDTGELDERLTLTEYKNLLNRRTQEVQVKTEQLKGLKAQLARAEAIGKKALDEVTPLSVAHLRREASAYAQEALACLQAFTSVRERLALLNDTPAGDWVNPVAVSLVSLLQMVGDEVGGQLHNTVQAFGLDKSIPEPEALQLAVPGPEEADFIRNAMSSVLIDHANALRAEEHRQYKDQRDAAPSKGRHKNPPKPLK